MIMKYFRMFAVLCAAAIALLGHGYQVQAASNQWEARYYNNKTLSGDPKYTVNESAINHNWSHGTPFSDINKDAFSVKWRRTVNIGTSGTYRFTATMDDGMRVWVDGNLIIDSWTDSQEHSMSKDVYLSNGDHEFKVDYYEAGGVAVAKLDWTLIGVNPSTPPANPTNIYNWKGEYFNNTSLTGLPVLTRDDSQVNFDWGVNSPALNVVASDNFSARWTRTVPFAAGSYRFSVTADDGVRLWVDGIPVVDQWKDSASTTYTVDMNVRGGDIPLRMEYYDRNGGAVAKLSWVQLSSVAPAQPAGVWYAEYFNNKNLAGTPLSTRNENVIDFNWGYSSPVPGVVNVDTFSARWTRNVELPAGTYRFTAAADDGIRVFVNNVLVINAWSDHAVQTFVADVTVSGGVLPIKVEYYDHSLLAEAHVSWVKVNGNPSQPTTPTTPTTPTGTNAVVNTGALNIRSGPGVNYTVVSSGQFNETLTLTGYRANVGTSLWVSVKKGNGTSGWVNSRYLTTSYALNTLTVWP